MRVTTYLDNLVPTCANDNRVLRIRAESNARNPLSVALVGDSVLAIPKGVPELDSTIAGTRDDLTVIGGE
jgi:hypothetical protein